MPFELVDAILMLNMCTRNELRDAPFGDVEVRWHDVVDVETACGHFGRDAYVSIAGGKWVFTDDDARELRDCGILGDVERNDTTGPFGHEDGVILPTSGTEVVLAELRADLVAAGWREIDNEHIAPPIDLAARRARRSRDVHSDGLPPAS